MKNLKLFLLLFLFSACYSPKEIVREVPVEVVKTEYKTQYIHDTTYNSDTTFIYQKGDTIFKDRTVYKYVGKTVHDTLITHDTIPQTVTITETKVVKEKVPQWWPIWLSLGIVVLYFLITKTKFIEKLKEFIKYIINIFK